MTAYVRRILSRHNLALEVRMFTSGNSWRLLEDRSGPDVVRLSGMSHTTHEMNRRIAAWGREQDTIAADSAADEVGS